MRSKVKKKLRTINRDKISDKAEWMKEAEQRRLAAAQKCLASAPVPVVNKGGEAMEIEQQRRGRSGNSRKGGATAMAIDSNAVKKVKGGITKRVHTGPKILVASVHGAKRKSSTKQQRSKSHGRKKH